MSHKKHEVKTEAERRRDHEHLRHPFWRHAHQDWRVWVAVVLMVALILVYVFTDSLSLRPGKLAHEPTPAANAP